MRAVFVELPAFDRFRADYLDDESFRQLQIELIANPLAGDVIEGAGGLRKLRFSDKTRSKGKRGGLRIIYYWWNGGMQFWLFTLFDKDEVKDLTPGQRKLLKARIKAEIAARSSK